MRSNIGNNTMNNAIEIKPSTDKEIKFIQDSLIQFNTQNVPFTQKIPFEKINYVAKNEKKEITAGIKSILYGWGVLFVDLLWVSEAYRGHGIGSHLMHKVEETAKQKGCTLIHLDTFDFQAKDFYLKLGYEIFGTLEDCPPGHKRYYLKKKI